MITIERTFDPAIVREISLHPDLWKTNRNDFLPETKTHLTGSDRHYIISQQNYILAAYIGDLPIGLFYLEPSVTAGVYQAHIHVLPAFRSEYATEIGLKSINWFFDNTDNVTIVAFIPTVHRHVTNYATKRLGFRQCGVIPSAFKLNDELHDITMISLNRNQVKK